MREEVAWTKAQGEGVRRAGVSSFGVSGTNAHLIVEEAPEEVPVEVPVSVGGASEGSAPVSGDGSGAGPVVVAWDRLSAVSGQESAPISGETSVLMPVPVVVSGASGAGLEATAARWAGFLRDQDQGNRQNRQDRADGSGVSVVDVGVTAGAGRAGLEHRAVVLARDTAELAGLLEEVAAGREPSGVVRGTASAGAGAGSGASAGAQVVFAFPGQGTQWVGMGARLLAESPVFAARMAECAAALGPFVDFDVLAVARGDADAASLERVEVVQPVSWAVMVALAALWEAVGVRPSAVVGHSQGEVAAACVAGVLSLADGARVVAERSRIIAGSLAGAGAMAAVALSPEQVQERLDADAAAAGSDAGADPAWGGVSVAAVNGPSSVVVSGDTTAVENLVREWSAEGVRVRRIAVDYASHSVQVEQVREELIAALEPIVPGAGRVPFYSTVRGEVVAGTELGAQYWYWNLRLPVGFAGVVEQLVSEGRGVVVEVSAHPVLGVGVQELVEAAGGAVVGSLRRGEGGLDRFLESVGRVFVCGVGVDWPAVFTGSGGQSAAGLPTYAFQRQRYWLNPAPAPVGVDHFWQSVSAEEPDELAARMGVDPAAVRVVLPALEKMREQDRERSLADEWRYKLTWRPVHGRKAGDLVGRWLVLVPEGLAEDKAARAIMDGLQALDGVPVQILPVAADSREGLAEAIRTAADGDGDQAEVAGVVSLLALDDDPHPVHPGMSQGMAATILAVQALADAAVSAPFWLVTRCGVVVEEAHEPVSPEQSALWGLGAVLALDQPRSWGGLIDMPADPDGSDVGELVAALSQPGEDQVAIRRGATWARRLERAPVGAAGPPQGEWRPHGTVLVTGGTGGVGANVARWLAREGAEHLVLVSRSGSAAAGVQELVAELTASGARVSVVACDVADRGALRDAVAGVAEWSELTGVLHAAGVGHDGVPLGETTLAEFSAATRAKVMGAANLAELLADHPLDVFLMFSSGAAVWGQGGMAPYAAANAYLDGLVWQRRANGLNGSAIAWGAWGGGGMVDAFGAEQMAKFGIRVMPPEPLTTLIGQVVAGGESHLVVADIDWRRFAPVFAMARPRPLMTGIADYTRALTESEPSDDASAAAAFRTALAEMSEPDRVDELTRVIRESAARVLGHTTPDSMGAGQHFLEAGFDSLTAMELRNKLNATTGVQVPTTAVFDHATPAELARHLAAEFVAGKRALAGGAEAPEAPTSGETLSDLLRGAIASGKIHEGLDVLEVTAKLRPSFAGPEEVVSPTEPVRLASGPNLPRLYCFSTPMVLGGAAQFARLATHFQGVRDVYALPVPGFGPDEALPETVDAVVRTWAQTITATDEPFALLGYCAGGMFAHAAATLLEEAGTPPSGLVLLDVFLPETSIIDDLGYQLVEGMFAREESFGPFTSARLAAMGRYYRLFQQMRLGDTAAPVLFIRPDTPLPSGPEGIRSREGNWRSSWAEAHDLREVRGDHLSMLEGESASMAGAIEPWLSGLARHPEGRGDGAR
ncbi:SDR family NAD(P)-dependent oxidoreductase [Murinocardiopsis flavida]|uniref:SDR family NAD(P)-dependent oxidoreductase n=1 Tax=Murinocardiopsis flavida TaxID=645275 RepID=UPI0011B25D73|nr:SDR family NAD(P)-dependent oxidoreductase [Murinocardiopsis flavida]